MTSSQNHHLQTFVDRAAALASSAGYPPVSRTMSSGAAVPFLPPEKNGLADKPTHGTGVPCPSPDRGRSGPLPIPQAGPLLFPFLLPLIIRRIPIQTKTLQPCQGRARPCQCLQSATATSKGRLPRPPHRPRHPIHQKRIKRIQKNALPDTCGG